MEVNIEEIVTQSPFIRTTGRNMISFMSIIAEQTLYLMIYNFILNVHWIKDKLPIHLKPI